MQSSNEQRIETRHALWTSGEVTVAVIALVTLAAAAAYAVFHGLRLDDLCITLLMGSVVAKGAYDTRHNQPTRYNLLRSWPLGSAAEDEQRGQYTVSSQALHGLFCVSLCLCLALIAFRRP